VVGTGLGVSVFGIFRWPWRLHKDAKESINQKKTCIKLNTFAVAVMVCGLFYGSTPKAHAQEASAPDPVYSALRDYVQQAGLEEAQTAGSPQVDDDDALAVLRQFTRALPSGQPVAVTSGQFKIAAADNAFDALREFLQKGNGDQPSAAPAAKTPAIKPQAPVVAASTVGSKVCLGCHTSQADIFSHTMMGRLQTQGKMSCESCHGPGSEHVRLGGGRGVGGIISFRTEDDTRTPEENNAICLGCHKRGERTNWDASVHETRGLACTSCHTVMKSVSRKSQLKTAFEPDTCFQCHKDKRAQTSFSSHMPIGGGKMVCSDCHNPHGSFTEGLLRTDSINDTCYKCHAEKRGPFLVEHMPVRENCLNCHNPHGSVNPDMLKMSPPRLCFECHGFGHGQTSGVNSVFTMGRACLNCHTAIHGSNSPAGFFLQR
jgi:DmsE family decaheme c-type cytochrome